MSIDTHSEMYVVLRTSRLYPAKQCSSSRAKHRLFTTTRLTQKPKECGSRHFSRSLRADDKTRRAFRSSYNQLDTRTTGSSSFPPADALLLARDVPETDDLDYLSVRCFSILRCSDATDQFPSTKYTRLGGTSYQNFYGTGTLERRGTRILFQSWNI